MNKSILLSGICVQLLLLLPVHSSAGTVVKLTDFSSATPFPATPWKIIRFDENVPATRYHYTLWQGVNAIEANATGSMALLARPVSIDLQVTPIICWRWWVDAPLDSANMQTKAGDDYAARLYLTFDLPDSQLSFSTRFQLQLARAIYGDVVPEAAINYVWDNRYPVGTQQANAYTDRAQMVVVRSGSHLAKQWLQERRNVAVDAEQIWQSNGAKLIQLAIATDTDNTGESARALFADIHFVATNASCQFGAP